jgi:hypothetical protein
MVDALGVAAAGRVRGLHAVGGLGGDMRERPILFSGPMVNAILDGRKTMTRRVVKMQPLDILPMNVPDKWITLDVKEPEPHGKIIKCRLGFPGDRLWVRETFQIVPPNTIFYKADKENTATKGWKPSIFMPRWASRITLEITDVRIERLQEISREDAINEGLIHVSGKIEPDWWRNGINEGTYLSPNKCFAALWDSINSKKHPWSSNSWVWAISFMRIKP